MNNMANDELTVDYSGKFEPEWYMDTYYSCSLSGKTEEDNFFQFNLDYYHNIFQSGDVKGKTLLDIGTGPSVHSVISACRHVDDVYLTDFAAQNRKVLIDWWKTDKTMIENLTKYVMSKENSRLTVEKRQKIMKEKVRDVLPIDITLSDPIGSGCDVTEFDIITSSLCLEAAAQTLDQYRANLVNVSSLLKSGGHLILNGVLGQTWYRVGEAKFSCVALTRDDVESTFVSCGFNIESIEVVMNRDDPYYSDFHGYFIMHAVKMS